MVGIAGKLPNKVAFKVEICKGQRRSLRQSKPPCSRWKAYSAAEAIAAAKVQREEVYYATFPLVGMESLEGALVFSGRELPKILAQHCAIIVERPSEGRCMVYDFLPEAPTAPATAASLLSGRPVTGIVRQRAMRRVPPRRCTWIGTSVVPNAMKQAEDFNHEWDKRLSLFTNDCRHHSCQLARILLDDPYWDPEPV